MDMNDSSLSAALLITIQPKDIAMFRFILEAHSHLAYFTVIERQTAILKLAYPKALEAKVLDCLEEIAATVSFSHHPWPKFESIAL